MKNRNLSDEYQTAKAGLLNSLANIFCLLAGVLFVPITSRILSAEDLGKAVSFTTTREIIFFIITLSLTHSISLGMIDYSKQKRRFISSIFLFASMCIFVVFLICFIFKQHLVFLFFGSEFLFYWMFFIILCQLGYEIILNYVNFHNRYIISFIIILLSNPVALLASTFMVINLQTDKFLGRIVGMDFFLCSIGIAAIIAILVTGKFRISMKHVKYGLRITLPLIAYTLSSLILIRSDTIIITYFKGADKAGIYLMAFTIANILFAILIQISKSWSPWVYRKLELKEITPIYENSKLLIVFAFIAGVGLMSISPELVHYFLAKEYHECMTVICPIVIGMFFRFLNQFYYDVEYFYKKNKFIAVSSIFAAVLNIVLNVSLINVFGYSVCAITTALCYGLLTVMHYLYIKKIDSRKIYDTKYILWFSVAFVFSGIVISLFTGNWIIRYCLLAAVMIATCIFERKNLFKIKNMISGFISLRVKK